MVTTVDTIVEPTRNGATFVYDSLKGLQQLTVELSRTLHVVGLLLMSANSDKPILTNAKLCQAAGKVPLHQKCDKPIRVAARKNDRPPEKERTGSASRSVTLLGKPKRAAMLYSRKALSEVLAKPNKALPLLSDR